MHEFLEEKLIVLALEDIEADSGNHDELDNCLRDCYHSELMAIRRASALLSDRAAVIIAEKYLTGQL